MPIEIQRLVSRVDVQPGEARLSEVEIDQITRRVVARLRDLERADARQREATDLRPQASPPPWRGE